MKRITISLQDDLYRIAKAYAQSEDISLSKAVVELMRRGMEGGSTSAPGAKLAEDAGPYAARDPVTGILVSKGSRPIPDDAAQRAEEEDDLRKWSAGS